MTAHGMVSELGTKQSSPLDSDSRWHLVQRVVASEEFQRAAQLRSILLYVSKSAILHPDATLNEYQIACDVLGRQADFNPALDNIVRAQVSHLRRKLGQYYDHEGKNEPVVLTIPKGSYIPIFVAHSQPQELLNSLATSQAIVPDLQDGENGPKSNPSLVSQRRGRMALVSALVGCFVVGAIVAWFMFRAHIFDPSRVAKVDDGNEFVHFLARSDGDATVVVPDLSLALLGKSIGKVLSLPEYMSDSYPSSQLAQVKDLAERQALSRMMAYRNTTMNEAMVALDFKESLQRSGDRVRIRYSRDLHVADLSQGNTILIGGQGSNPWTSLFADRMNFRRRASADYSSHYFENLHPKAGEQSQYQLVFAEDGHTGVGYVDVALTQNPSHTGYILLIDGADAQASEAATRFLLHGKLPPEIVSILERKDLNYFEFFLRGKHFRNESDDTFELVATRPQ